MKARIAELRNVGAFLGLLERVVTRPYGLEGMAVFHGASGLGKTTAVIIGATEFKARWVEVGSNWTKKHMLQKILQQYGVKPPRASIAELTDITIETMLVNDVPLIIDDAQYCLQKGMIETVRDLYKKTEVPVILVGEEALPANLTRWENIHNLQLAWEPAIPCNVADARRLAAIYAPDIEVGEDLLKRIVEITHGSTRRIAHNLAEVQEKARHTGMKHVSLAEWDERRLFSGQPPLSVTRPVASVTGITPLPRSKRAG
ncbi:AAA family ATPase [Marivita sp.]|jgi:DNA transposition AAA+ family ATPase|uniref:AAA family ATPase n=1 Tax=Marivita sp. TaxID=2003365 RepID=UPI003F6E4715